MKKKRRIFYDVSTGNVIIDTGEAQGYIKQTTAEADAQTYKALSERNSHTFEYIELEYGQYAQDFTESNGYRVNPETKELEFSYPDPNEPEVEQPYQAPLSEEVAALKMQNDVLMIGVADTYEAQQENADMLLNAVAEVYEIVLGGGQ